MTAGAQPAQRQEYRGHIRTYNSYRKAPIPETSTTFQRVIVAFIGMTFREHPHIVNI